MLKIDLIFSIKSVITCVILLNLWLLTLICFSFMSANNHRDATTTEPRLEDFEETTDSESSDNEIIKA